MAEITLESFQSQSPALEKQPGVEIEFKEEEKQFRVKVGKLYYGWFVDRPSNRKAVLVFLREMYECERGKRVFTEEELAARIVRRLMVI